MFRSQRSAHGSPLMRQLSLAVAVFFKPLPLPVHTLSNTNVINCCWPLAKRSEQNFCGRVLVRVYSPSAGENDRGNHPNSRGGDYHTNHCRYIRIAAYSIISTQRRCATTRFSSKHRYLTRNDCLLPCNMTFCLRDCLHQRLTPAASQLSCLICSPRYTRRVLCGNAIVITSLLQRVSSWGGATKDGGETSLQAMLLSDVDRLNLPTCLCHPQILQEFIPIALNPSDLISSTVTRQFSPFLMLSNTMALSAVQQPNITMSYLAPPPLKTNRGELAKQQSCSSPS